MAETTNSEESGKKKSGFSQATLDKAAYTATGLTAVGMADNTIKDTYYRKYKDAHDVPGISDARAARGRARQKIFSEGEPSNHLSMKRAIDLRNEEKKFTQKIRETFEKTGMYNDAQYFTALDSTAKWQVFERVATVSGIVLAASLALSKAMSRDESRSADR